MFHSPFLRLAPVLTFFAASLCAQSPAVITDVINAATKERRFAPGTVVDVIGSNLGTDPRTATASVGGLRARVISASNTRWTIVIPVTLQPGPVTVDIGLSNIFNITLTAYAPGLFTADGSGTGIPSAWGFRLNQNGALILPGYALSATAPAKLGDVLVLMATGLGAVDASNYNEPYEKPSVTIAGKPMLVMFATFIDSTSDIDACYICQPGYYEVMVALPEALAVRDQPLVMTVAGQASQTVTVPINSTPIVKGVVNAASFKQNEPLVPGALASVFGTTFGVTDQLEGFPGTDFAGVSVSFNGVKSPLLALVASSGQINLQLPAELPEAGPVTIKVTTPDGFSSDYPAELSAAAPGVFVIPSRLNPRRRNAAVLVNETEWRVMPEDLAQEWNMPVNCRASGIPKLQMCGEPARRLDNIQIYATGLGKAAPDRDLSRGTLATGEKAPQSPLYETIVKPIVTVGGVPVDVLYSGLAPGFAGLYQINIQIPENAPIGDDVPISIEMNGRKDDLTTIAIRQ